MGGQLVTSINQNKPPFWVRNLAFNQLYLSTHHLSDKNAEIYVQALNEFQPTHMIVYPSSAVVLASSILERHLNTTPMKVIISNAETIFPQQREIISQAFRCPIRNTYGMGEYIYGASECEYGKMHIWPEVGLLEVLKEDKSQSQDNQDVGSYLITGLLNLDMPLIRYEVGDHGSGVDDSTICACGRNLPVLRTIDGRTNDLIILPDGRKVFWINPVFYGIPVIEAQIIQEDYQKLVVLYKPASGYTYRTGDEILRRLHERVGTMDITLKAVDIIPRMANGKFKAVISKLPK